MWFSKKIMQLLLMTTLVAGFTACSNDDDEFNPIDEPTEEPTGSFTLPEQPLVEGMVVVKKLTMSNDGWIVVRRDDGNEAPDLTEIISYPEYVDAGTYQEVFIELQENIDLLQGERLWVNLHNDNGDQEFTYDGNNDVDLPLYYGDLMWGFYLITHSFLVDLPTPTGSINAEDQVLDHDRNLIISSVNNSHPGWIVVYPDHDGQPYLDEPISIPRYIVSGTHSDLQIELEDNIEIDNNQLFWVVLHTDDGDHIFEFLDDNSSDQPVLNSNNENVQVSLTISFNWPTGSLTVADQLINESRAIVISSIEMNDEGWVVLHKDLNGVPFSSETISEPLFLDAGTYENVELDLKEGIELAFGEKIWAALYSDNGNNIYESDGTGDIDAPFLKTDATPVIEHFIAYDTSSLEFFWLLTHPYADISAIPLFDYEPGWIVVYRDNGNGAPNFSEIVSTPEFIADSHILIDFVEGEEVSDQEVLWFVLHTDNGDGIFEYDPGSGVDLVAEDEFGRKIMQAFIFGNLTWL